MKKVGFLNLSVNLLLLMMSLNFSLFNQAKQSYAQTDTTYIETEKGKTLTHIINIKNTGKNNAAISLSITGLLGEDLSHIIKSDLDAGNVTLSPGEEQQINLTINTNDLEEGQEYPVTLIFHATDISNPDQAQTVKQSAILGKNDVIIKVTPPIQVNRIILGELKLPEPIEKIGEVSSIIVVSSLPVVNLISILSRLGGNFTFNIFSKTLQSIGLLPSPKPQGAVLDSLSQKGVPFAILTFFNLEDKNSIAETAVTNALGFYKGVQLIPGEYQMTVQHQDYTFPTKNPRPIYLQIRDFYKGESFRVDSPKIKQSFLTPLDPIAKSEKTSIIRIFKLIFRKISQSSQALTIPIFLLSLFLALVFPTPWNFIIVAFYSLGFIKKILSRLIKADIYGDVTSKDGHKLSEVIIRLKDPQTGELTNITTSTKKGNFEFRNQKGLYQILANKTGWIWQPSTQGMSLAQIDSSKNKQKMDMMMNKIEN
jgi:hypothetical protein